ncbi:MAG: FAD-binding protein, partial [Deltaproteobacteria bacterium]|nr:FAD-binding protein [Deltaproteobacteria bacterium]
MTSSNGRFDVIIIGTGAGGGTLAHRLAPSGKKVLLLER